MNSAKRVVLLRGEKGFSQAMFKGGFKSSFRGTELVLIERLNCASNKFLWLTLKYAAYDDLSLVIAGRELLEAFEDSTAWRNEALAHMKIALSNTDPLGIFIYATVLLLDFSFLKKRSSDRVFEGMRWQYLQAVKNGDLPAPHPDILAEILDSTIDGSFTTDPSLPLPVGRTKTP